MGAFETWEQEKSGYSRDRVGNHLNPILLGNLKVWIYSDMER